MNRYEIRPEQKGDEAAVDGVHRRAFGGHGDKVVALVALLRKTAPPLRTVSPVALDEGRIAGHIMLSAARLDAVPRLVDVLTLSPLAVDPGQQRRGIGRALIAAALEQADRCGVPLVFLEGSPDYYGRAGFARASRLGFRAPSLRIPDAAFQVAVRPAFQPWMTGSFVYTEPFWALDCVGLRDS